MWTPLKTKNATKTAIASRDPLVVINAKTKENLKHCEQQHSL